jgi:hypothetical protein
MSDFNLPVQGIAGPLTIEADHQIIETMRAWANGEPVWSYDEIIRHWGREFVMYRLTWNDPDPLVRTGNVERIRETYELRTAAIHEFGFSIPCKELLDALEACQPIVEVGAGSGYMTQLMRHRGIDVVGTDSGIGHGWITLGKWDAHQIEMPAKRAVRHFRDRTVFCSWPSLQETWFRQALRAMRVGQKAIIIEEDACAEQSTWDYRDKAFKPVASIPLPAWPMLNDRAGIWIKKREASIGQREERFDWDKTKKLWSEGHDESGDGGEHTRAAVDSAAATQGDPQAPASATERQGA